MPLSVCVCVCVCLFVADCLSLWLSLSVPLCLAQDVPDFEDTADHDYLGAHGSLPSAPEQPPQPQYHIVPVRPSSAHPRLQSRTQSAGRVLSPKDGQPLETQESGLLTEEEASVAKGGTNLSISLGEKGAFKKALKGSGSFSSSSSSAIKARPSSLRRASSEASRPSSISFDHSNSVRVQ